MSNERDETIDRDLTSNALTPEQRHILENATAWRERSKRLSRNHFVTHTDAPDWDACHQLCLRGLMKSLYTPRSKDCLFTVTEDGLALLRATEGPPQFSATVYSVAVTVGFIEVFIWNGEERLQGSVWMTPEVAKQFCKLLREAQEKKAP